MHIFIKLTFIVLISLLPFSANAADAVVATINGQAIKQTLVDAIKQDNQGNVRQTDDKAILSQLMRNELLAQEAVRLGIEKRPEFTAREEIRRRELLANLLINDHLKNNPITDDMFKAEYERFKKQLGDKEYNAKHIQVQTEAEARDIIAQLAKGADFAELAKAKSKDTGTKENGGSIGWFTKNAITPLLAEAASKLQKGLFTTVPIQTNLGWHVLKLEDVRDFKAPTLDKVKEQLRQYLNQQQIAKLLESLRVKAKIEIVK